MDIFGILTMLGGLAMFLYGMQALGNGLEQLSGGRLEKVLERLTSNRFKAVLFGALVTGAIQSSSATTVMVVGFVNSGIMKLSQAVGIIMGGNIGTTITSWMLSLTGIESDNFFMQMLKPSSFAPILAVIGIVFLMQNKSKKRKDIGGILLGFTVLMFGMQTMSDAVKPLADNEAFTSILTKFSNPILGLLAGVILTAAIQSSSASVGILQALCATGAVSFGAAVPIVMGQNIGTCVTALISSVGSSKNAKRASMIHLYFNLIASIVFLVLFYGINWAIGGFSFMNEYATASGVAVIHSLFNVGAVLLLYPFSNWLVKLAEITIRDDKEAEDEETHNWNKLDERFLDRPELALQMSKEVTKHMAWKVKEAINLAIQNRSVYQEDALARVIELENDCDQYEDKLRTYLMRVSGKTLSDEGKRRLLILEQAVGNLERMSDHAVNLTDATRIIHEKNMPLSDEAIAEVSVYEKALNKMLDITVESFDNEDMELAKSIEPLEQVINRLYNKTRRHHLRRLRDGDCNIELGVYMEDYLTSMERIGDHCSNIGACLLGITDDEFDTHEYMNDIKESPDEEYIAKYEEFKETYQLPELAKVE